MIYEEAIYLQRLHGKTDLLIIYTLIEYKSRAI